MSCMTCLKVLAVVWILFSARELYFVLVPDACDPALHGGYCLEPLFPTGEKIDVHFYTTTTARLDWRRDFARLAHLHTIRGLPFGEGFQLGNHTAPGLRVPVPQSVRRNGSLYAHIFVVRAGLPANPRKHPPRRRVPGSWGNVESHEYKDLLHVSAPLTRHLPEVVHTRRSLVRNSAAPSSAVAAAAKGRNGSSGSNSSGGGGGDARGAGGNTQHGRQAQGNGQGQGQGSGSGQQREQGGTARTVRTGRTGEVWLPFGIRVLVDAPAATGWSLTFFAATAVLGPSMPLAVVRHALVALVIPVVWAVVDDADQIDSSIDKARAKGGKEVASSSPSSASSPSSSSSSSLLSLAINKSTEAMFRKTRPAVTHWRPTLSIRIVQDDARYPPPPRFAPPRLFEQLVPVPGGGPFGSISVRTRVPLEGMTLRVLLLLLLLAAPASFCCWLLLTAITDEAVDCCCCC